MLSNSIDLESECDELWSNWVDLDYFKKSVELDLTFELWWIYTLCCADLDLMMSSCPGWARWHEACRALWAARARHRGVRAMPRPRPRHVRMARHGTDISSCLSMPRLGVHVPCHAVPPIWPTIVSGGAEPVAPLRWRRRRHQHVRHHPRAQASSLPERSYVTLNRMWPLIPYLANFSLCSVLVNRFSFLSL